MRGHLLVDTNLWASHGSVRGCEDVCASCRRRIANSQCAGTPSWWGWRAWRTVVLILTHTQVQRSTSTVRRGKLWTGTLWVHAALTQPGVFLSSVQRRRARSFSPHPMSVTGIFSRSVAKSRPGGDRQGLALASWPSGLPLARTRLDDDAQTQLKLPRSTQFHYEHIVNGGAATATRKPSRAVLYRAKRTRPRTTRHQGDDPPHKSTPNNRPFRAQTPGFVAAAIMCT